MKRELNKWQVAWDFTRCWEYNQLGWRNAHVGVLKLTSLPPEGIKVSKANYKGFLLEWRFWLPWELR